MKGPYLWLTVVIAVCCFSCETTTTEPPPGPDVNAPVTANVTNTFTYSVNANQFSDNSQNTLNFLSDSLVVTLSSSEYLSGQAIVSLRDSVNASVFSDTVRSNKTIAIVNLKTTRPKSCSIVVTNLTGKLVFVVVGQ